MLHKNVVANTDDIHAVSNWTVADAAARAALVLVLADVGKICWQLDTDQFYVLKTHTGPPTWLLLNVAPAVQKVEFGVAISDLSTLLTVGIDKAVFFAPCDLQNITTFVGVATQQAAGSLLTFNVKKNGTTMYSTKPTIDNNESTSLTAATPPVHSVNTWTKGDKISIDIDQVGTALAKGASVYFSGDRP